MDDSPGHMYMCTCSENRKIERVKFESVKIFFLFLDFISIHPSRCVRCEISEIAAARLIACARKV